VTTTPPAPATVSIADQAAQLLTELLGEVDQVDPTPVTMAMIHERLGQPLYAEFRISLHNLAHTAKTTTDDAIIILAEELADVRAALTGPGFILHTPDRQALITEIGTRLGWSSGLVSALRGITIRRIPRWQLEGRPTAPTIETLTAELEAAARESAAAANAAAFAAVREQWVAAYAAALQFIGRIEATGDAPPTLAAILHHIGRS
jgi:hypothetical protein